MFVSGAFAPQPSHVGRSGMRCVMVARPYFPSGDWNRVESEGSILDPGVVSGDSACEMGSRISCLTKQVASRREMSRVSERAAAIPRRNSTSLRAASAFRLARCLPPIHLWRSVHRLVAPGATRSRSDDFRGCACATSDTCRFYRVLLPLPRPPRSFGDGQAVLAEKPARRD